MPLLFTLNPLRPPAQLPPEVLVLIFELATYNSTRKIDKLAGLPPFEEVYADDRMKRDRGALRMKHALALTCSYFRKLTTSILYEDVWLQHGFETFRKVLQGSRNASGLGLGRLVKRITLPSMLPASTTDVISEILSLCPNLRALSRLPAATGERCEAASSDDSTLNDLSFSQLHRVDWPSTCLECTSSTSMSPRFVWRSSCLCVLSLNSANHFIPDQNIQSGDERQILIDLPQLHTLRFKSCDVLGDPEEFRFVMNFPCLRRIVLERPLALYALHAGCLSALGPQIKTLEFGRYPRFLRIDAVSIALGYCPNVETLLFPVFSTMPPARNHPDTSRSEWITYPVKHIGLNASVEQDCDYQVSRTWMWVQLGDLVDALFGDGTRFTALERITLFGSEWREFVHDDKFLPIAKAMSNRVRIDCEDDAIKTTVQ